MKKKQLCKKRDNLVYGHRIHQTEAQELLICKATCYFSWGFYTVKICEEFDRPNDVTNAYRHYTYYISSANVVRYLKPCTSSIFTFFIEAIPRAIQALPGRKTEGLGPLYLAGYCRLDL
jgi:hypothetical protein